MFEEEKNIEKYSLSITIGLKISHEMINEKIKFNLESLTENHLNYLDLDKENKNKEILITIKNKVNEKGMISKNWINKFKNVPSVIIIYKNLGNFLNLNDNIINSFISEVEKIYNIYFTNNLKVYLILEYIPNFNINLKKITDLIKNKIFDILKNINPENIIFIPNENVLQYEELAKNILKDSKNYYSSCAQKYVNKLAQITNDKINYNQEDLVKNYIKLGILSKIFNKSLLKNKENCFEKAYEILLNNIEKNKYLFSIADERYIFIEKKYIANWLLYNILNSFNLNDSNIKFKIEHCLSIHLKHFNIENFIENKNLISFQLKLFNLYWKFEIYNYISKKFSFFQKTSLSIFGIINSLLRLNKYYQNNKRDIDNSNLNFLLDNLTIEQSKYIEKIPKFFINKKEISDVNQRLKYYYLYLFKEKNINFEEINKNIISHFKNLLGNFFKNNEQYNFYTFYLGNLFNIFNLNEKEKYFNNLILKNENLKNFPKIYQNLITEYDELIINNNLDSNENNNNNINKNILFKLSKNYKLTENEKKKFNSILSNNNLNNNITNYKIYNNDLFEINYNFNKNYVNSFEKIEFFFEIKKKHNEINFNIKEIQLIFNHSNRNFSFKLLNKNNEDNFIIKNKYEFIALQKDNFLYLNKIIFILDNNIRLENIIKVDKKNILNVIEETEKIEFNKFQQFFDINYKINAKLSENECHYFNISILNKNNQNQLKIISIRANFILNVVLAENNNNDFKNEFNFILLDKNGEIKQKIENTNLILNLENNNNNNEFIFEFLLKIKYSNRYLLNFTINYELINSNFPEQKFFYESEHSIKIKCVNGFILNNNNINSNIFILNQLNEDYKNKSFLSNNLINYKIEILSQLNDDCLIKDLIINHNNNLEIKSNILKLLKKNFQLKILAKNIFSIPFTIKSYNDFSGSIGTLILKWTTKELEKYSNNKMINEINIKLDDINIEKFNYLIENEIKNNNKEYILNITNLNNEFKNIEISFDLKDSDKYLLQGLIRKQQIIFPNEKLTIKYEINFINKILNLNKFKPASIVICEYDDTLDKKKTLSYINYIPNFLKLEN